MATVGTRRVTLEEFLRLPEGPPNFEFEEGELVPVPSPTIAHQDLVGCLWNTLNDFSRKSKHGRAFMGVDVFLPDGRVLIPDITYLLADHLSLIDSSDQKIHGSPDLVVEITSSAESRDRVHKFRVYHDNHVPWYWIVDQDTYEIDEFQASQDGYNLVAHVDGDRTFEPQLIPGLKINLKRLLSE